MKTTLTFFKLIAIFQIVFFTNLFSAQTHFFQDAVANGTIWHNGAAEVANPKSDAVNSSSIVLQNDGNASWQETQFFPSGYTVKAGDKFFISFYNPNGAANWQLRMDLSTSGSFVQISGSDPAHHANAATGWTEVSLDLSTYVGENITKIQLYPTAGEAKSIYYDNVFVGSGSENNTVTKTYLFQEAVENGTIWHNGAAEVANPKSDAVNSSSIVLQNTGASGWQETQFFPTGYTVKAGDKFFISFYNPNGAANWQLRMDLSTSGSFVQISGADPAHDANAATGWTEVSLDLSAYEGQNISKVQLYPVAGDAKSIYYDNVYIGSTNSGNGGGSNTQTYFYQEAVVNGTIWHNGVSDVANPKSDAINTSSMVLQNTGASGWQETQFFPSGYTVKAGDKFFISFYNPNGAANWQLRMDLSTSGSFVQISGSDPAHHANAATGWNEVNLDLSTYAGQNITKIQLYPAAGNAKSIYYDNIYIASETVLNINTFDTLTNRAFISQDGRIQFTNELQNATIYVFDLKGAQILKETITGKVSQNSISKKGLYFVKIISKEGTGNYKVFFN